jgi:hypothetical protein
MFLALLVGTGMLLLSVLLYGMVSALIVRLVVRWTRAGGAAVGFWREVAVMMVVTIITAAMHLAQITLWAVTLLLLCVEIPTFETALYCSAQNYTALGYGDVPLSQWRLLGPLEAINGLLLFGLSTAVMFAALSRLVKNRFSVE